MNSAYSYSNHDFTLSTLGFSKTLWPNRLQQLLARNLPPLTLFDLQIPEISQKSRGKDNRTTAQVVLPET
ncbi:MAG: hypothetical protein LUO94_08250, partial [Methylococcaceae bacterium]|nr:hypothetical protein [Methylococcaceae bacterium]